MKEDIFLLDDQKIPLPLSRFEKIIEKQKWTFKKIGSDLSTKLVRPKIVIAHEKSLKNIKKIVSRPRWLVLLGDCENKDFKVASQVIQLGTHEFEKLDKVLSFLKKTDEQRELESLMSSAQRNLKFYLREKDELAQEFLKQESEKEFFYELRNSYVSFFLFENLNELKRKLQKIFSKKWGLKKIDFVNQDQLRNSLAPKGRLFCLPLVYENEHHWMVVTLNKEQDLPFRESFPLLCLIELVTDIFDYDQSCAQIKAEKELYEKSFLKLPLPAVLLNMKGEVWAHNTLYSSLSLMPRACLQLNHGQMIECHNHVYKVFKQKMSVGQEVYQLILFFKGDSESISGAERPRLISFEELGIISSSIAHELNNPLAGIQVALSLLQTETHDPAVLKVLSQMIDGTKRCRDLVQIFLGFSKTSLVGQKARPPQDALNQALALLRFRMIEMNVNINISKTIHSQLQFSINYSILSMIFYLILNEFLTALAHENLIRQVDFSHTSVMEVQYVEEQNCITIYFPQQMNSQQIVNSRLIQSLILLSSLRLKISDHSFQLEVEAH